jgi:thioredoxin reductase
MAAREKLPVAVIGGGPVGLAAAAHLIARGLPVRLYEAGGAVGANLRDWAHVRVFTPWRYCVDAVAVDLLPRHGWTPPETEAFPTGGELVRQYLEPLAATPELRNVIETGARVSAITREGVDKVASPGRSEKAFVLVVSTARGIRRDRARAVVDASGTWQNPNPMGADGLAAEGESELSDRIDYGIPDISGAARETFAGRTTLVVGSGHSAGNALLDLARLATEDGRTKALWATRSTNLARIYSGGDADQLPARGELGAQVRQVSERGDVELITGFATVAVRASGGRVVVEGQTSAGLRQIGPVDRIIVATGQRPDLTLTRELRLELDPWLESVRALGSLIDPNLHSCGSVPPHGHRELSHPEAGFYTVGIKSYGRAPTFLLLTGYEQVRSVAAALAGDMAAADDVRLTLPETGICSTLQQTTEDAGESCCGGAALAKADACCAADAAAKDSGKPGCGCSKAA